MTIELVIRIKCEELLKEALEQIKQIDEYIKLRSNIDYNNIWYSIWWTELEMCKVRCRVLLNQREDLLNSLNSSKEYY